MRVLVTGASGFIGSAVVRALLHSGHDVLGLVRAKARGRAIESWGATLAIGDMFSPQSYQPLVEEVDAVIHTAQDRARGRWTRRKIRAMHVSDALMTRVLAQRCLAHGIPLIYTSGALAHRGVGAEWIDESTPLSPCLLARGHAEMVAELSRGHREQGLKAIILTPGFVYGPGGFLAESVELIQKNQYRVIGKGDNHWGLVHVDDLAEAYVQAIERGRPGENYFVCDDEPLTRRAVIDELTAGLGLPRVGSVPALVAGLWLGFPLVEAITASIRMRNERTRRALSWSPNRPSFREALPEALSQLGQRQRPKCAELVKARSAAYGTAEK